MSVEATESLVETSDANFQYPDKTESTWNGRIVSLGTFEFQQRPIVLSAQEPENNTEVTQEEADEHFDNANDHLGHCILDSVAAGVTATHPILIPVVIIEIKNASEHFVEACKEYNEGKKMEEEIERQRLEQEANSRETDDYDRSHDHDCWDREY